MTGRRKKEKDHQVVILSCAQAEYLEALLEERLGSVVRFERTYVALGKLPPGILDDQLQTIVGIMRAIQAKSAR